MLYPWTEQQWQQLQARREQGQLPHALLLCGARGLGKRDFAISLAKSLLCATPKQDGTACGQCRHCQQFEAGSHPDYYLLEPEESGKQIKIDQVRQLSQALALVSHQGGYRVVIIHPAENMNLAAANSLLKTLEEPPQNTMLLLVSAQPSLLPATILSRCQNVTFSAPERTNSINWLKNEHSIDAQDANILLAIARNAPLSALECAKSDQIELRNTLFRSLLDIANDDQSALQAVKPWLKLDLFEPINWLYGWISDLIRARLMPDAQLYNQDLSKDLHNLAQRVDLKGLFGLQDEVNQVLRYPRAPFNPQLVMENLILSWAQLFSRQQGNRR